MIPLWSSPSTSPEEVEVSPSFELGFEFNTELKKTDNIAAGFDLGFEFGAELEKYEGVFASFELGFEFWAQVENQQQELITGFELGFEFGAKLEKLESLVTGFEFGFEFGVDISATVQALPQYSCIAIQGAIGGPGRKATTLTPSYSFNSLGEINGVSIGLNNNGLYKIMTGDLVNGEQFTKSFTLKDHHFGAPGNLKKLRFIYIACAGDPMKLRVWVMADERTWLQCCYQIRHGRGVRVTAPSCEQGIYWAVKIESEEWFRIDQIQVLPIVRPAGIQMF